MEVSNECSYSTRLSKENIICSVSKLDVQIAIELQEPWASVPAKSEHYPQVLNSLVIQLAKSKLEFGINYFAKNEFSVEESTRIFVFKKNANEHSFFQKLEILVLNQNLNSVVPNIINYITTGVKDFDSYEVHDYKNTNEIFICTHAERDNCCGRYGIQLYSSFKEKIKQNYNLDYRAWKSSHIGGHRYAPTFYEAPAMRWYGLFDLNDINSYLNRDSNGFNVNNNYRGMSGITNKFAQLAENKLFKKYSWEWLQATNKSYEVIQNRDADSAMVIFYYTLPSHSSNLNKSEFKIQFERMASSMGSCASNEIKSVKQYLVEEI